jgi:small subunit ribosomal protein S27e
MACREIGVSRIMAGSFYRVKCPDCENEQTLFSRATTEITCAVCGHTLARPAGGDADIEAEVIDIVAAR